MLWSFSLVLTGAPGAAVAAGAGNPAAGGSLLSSAEPDSVLPVSLRPLRRSATHFGTSPLLISMEVMAEAGKGPDSDSLAGIEILSALFIPADFVGRTLVIILRWMRSLQNRRKVTFFARALPDCGRSCPFERVGHR